jgi:hypothetical protein
MVNSLDPTDPEANMTMTVRASRESNQPRFQPSRDTLYDETPYELDVISDIIEPSWTRRGAADRNVITALPAPPTEPVKDPNLVEWDGPNDPDNPQNFSPSKKWLITALFSSLTMWVTFSSSVFSQATGVTSEEFHVSTEVMTLGTSLPVFVSSPICQYDDDVLASEEILR